MSEKKKKCLDNVVSETHNDKRRVGIPPPPPVATIHGLISSGTFTSPGDERPARASLFLDQASSLDLLFSQVRLRRGFTWAGVNFFC